MALPHPSWRTIGWERRNPWFEAELLPGADVSRIPAFAESLGEIVALEPEPLSKYEIACGETAGA